jgi:outer membrane protein assembly factor BamB
LAGRDRSDHFFTINSADGDWQTHQRSPGHQGYVPISVDPTHFAYAWDWSRDPDSEPNGGINPVVTSDGKVYVSTDVYSGQGVLYALNELNGSEAWRVSFGQVPYLNPPAVHNGQVYVAVTGHQNTALWAFEADTGGYIFKSPFSSQWPSYMAPTVFGDQVYTGGGYYGGINYSFSTEDGSPLWSHSADGLWDMYTPAVNDSYVFHYNGDTLFMIDRATGETAAAIFDPFGNSSNDNEYFGAPMLGSNHNVFTFAGGAFSGSGGSSTEQYEQRVFSSFDIDSQTYEWSTSHAYLTAPAVASGVIYAARNNPMSLDAIDEVSGQVLWSWAPSAAEDSEFHRNIVVTRNILFVSTDKAVYAVDLASKTPVWKYPKPGMLAISANRMLYIATGARKSDGGLVAIDLQSEPEPSIPPS